MAFVTFVKALDNGGNPPEGTSGAFKGPNATRVTAESNLAKRQSDHLPCSYCYPVTRFSTPDCVSGVRVKNHAAAFHQVIPVAGLESVGLSYKTTRPCIICLQHVQILTSTLCFNQV